jgi:hypothetical protein
VAAVITSAHPKTRFARRAAVAIQAKGVRPESKPNATETKLSSDYCGVQYYTSRFIRYKN